MSQDIAGLFGSGLMITVLGMGLVFLGLGVIWGLIALLGRWDAPAPAGAAVSATAALPQGTSPETAADTQLTAERCRVAAIAAAALLSNVLPKSTDVPRGPEFEHGRTAPCWVTANRARALQPWQPRHAPEGSARAEV
jgi:Na+-transporting methylmalonyl-CoA/oxaloacetate decarboxylase gamma subunit